MNNKDLIKNEYSVYTIDHLTKEDLIEKYKYDKNVNHLICRIQHVDAVDDGREFKDLLGKDLNFNYIVSIHNFEHIPNPIRFLQRCENAISENGKVYLIIPDRRGTFDYFRPYTSIGQWMDAYRENRTVHSYSSFYDQFAYCVDGNYDYGAVNFQYSPQLAQMHISKSYRSSCYVDVHGFVYTPATFLFLITYIQKLGLTSLGVYKIVTCPNSNFEFLAILGKGEGPEVSLKEAAISMVGENINHRRSFHEPPASPQIPLRHQIYARIKKQHPFFTKLIYPFALAIWRIYKFFTSK